MAGSPATTRWSAEPATPAVRYGRDRSGEGLEVAERTAVDRDVEGLHVIENGEPGPASVGTNATWGQFATGHRFRSLRSTATSRSSDT